jgi:chemotaxis protein MotB
MAVVMLLLVMSVLQKQHADVKHQQEMARQSANQADSVQGVLKALQDNFRQQGVDELVNVDLAGGRLTLRDDVFSRGSACILPKAKTALAAVEGRIATFLQEHGTGAIYVEGHTDNVPVRQPVIDHQAYCTVYDDNFTLSAARAREARRFLVGVLDPESAKRVVVAGFGESRPIVGLHPADPRNRRVEVSFANGHKP